MGLAVGVEAEQTEFSYLIGRELQGTLSLLWRESGTLQVIPGEEEGVDIAKFVFVDELDFDAVTLFQIQPEASCAVETVIGEPDCY